MNENFTSVSPKSYCESLSKTDRRRFKNYVALELDISNFTLGAKLNGKAQWKPAELSMVKQIITSESWRQ